MRKISLLLLLVAATAAAQQEVNLGEAIVTGTREQSVDAEDLTQTITSVDRETLTENYRASLLPTLTEQVPGLFSTTRGLLGYGVNTGAGTLKVRGVGGMASLLVLVDGQPQYAGLMGHPIPDQYQTLLAERVDVVRGPASMLYGSNAMGGVVNIVTRRQHHEGWENNVQLQGGSYGTLEAAATSRYRKGRFSATGAYNFGRTDGHRANSGFEQHTGFLKLGYELARHWNLEGKADVTYFKASNPGTTAAPLLDNDQEITRGMAALALQNHYAKADGALRAYYNWGHHHINDGYSPGGTPRDVRYIHDDLVAGISLYETARFIEGNHTTFGFDYKHFGGEAFNRNVATQEHILLTGTDGTEFTRDEVAGYVDVRQDLLAWLSLEAGLRLDHHSRAGSELVPQGGLLFRLPREATLRATVSKGFRNPTIREMYMFPAKNDELQPERLMNYELAYRLPLLRGKLHVGANVFYLKAENLITQIRVDGRPHNVNSGSLENSGFELNADYKPCHCLRLNANYAFLHMSKAQEAAPEHKLYVGGSYTRQKWAVSSGIQYVAGLHTALGSEETESFLLWNATASCRPLSWMTCFVRGENLLAQRYEVLSGYPMPRATVMAGLSLTF
ncbi:MAG: TonB-dependent receptor [Alloprevotella sp.]|nr:TonB-dependent receptor [Alloprevotella sp.]